MRAFGMVVAAATLLTAHASAAACTCAYRDAFAEVSKAAPVVVHARVLRHSDRAPGGVLLAMLIEVISPMRDATVGERLKVWGDNGMLCRPYVTQFPVGTEWILALGTDRMFAPPATSGAMRQLSISGCGAHWLAVQDGKVIGEMRKVGVRDEMRLADFLRLYATGK